MTSLRACWKITVLLPRRSLLRLGTAVSSALVAMVLAFCGACAVGLRRMRGIRS
jgi:hypothetical protein